MTWTELAAYSFPGPAGKRVLSRLTIEFTLTPKYMEQRARLFKMNLLCQTCINNCACELVMEDLPLPNSFAAAPALVMDDPLLPDINDLLNNEDDILMLN